VVENRWGYWGERPPIQVVAVRACLVRLPLAHASPRRVRGTSSACGAKGEGGELELRGCAATVGLKGNGTWGVPMGGGCHANWAPPLPPPPAAAARGLGTRTAAAVVVGGGGRQQWGLAPGT